MYLHYTTCCLETCFTFAGETGNVYNYSIKADTIKKTIPRSFKTSFRKVQNNFTRTQLANYCHRVQTSFISYLHNGVFFLARYTLWTIFVRFVVMFIFEMRSVIIIYLTIVTVLLSEKSNLYCLLSVLNNISSKYWQRKRHVRFHVVYIIYSFILRNNMSKMTGSSMEWSAMECNLDQCITFKRGIVIFSSTEEVKMNSLTHVYESWKTEKSFVLADLSKERVSTRLALLLP